MSSKNAQYLRLRRPEAPKQTQTPTPRHSGILQDQIRRAARPPWCPSLSLAFRMLLLVRFSSAMYSNISDCDEVYNFWEPLHYLARGYGFQTWEVSPAYSIRSWAYILLHYLPATVPVRLLNLEKRQSFFALRIFFAVVSSFCEATLYRTIVEKINFHVGRYFLFSLMFSAGMWISSTAFLPSSFAMYANTLAFSYALQTPSKSNERRTFAATLFFGFGAIVGWPFALSIAIPFVLEELFVYGEDTSQAKFGDWFGYRIGRLVVAGGAAALFFIPVIGLDSLAYGRLTVVPWNIIKYNIFGGSERGPDLYGTEPWHFYISNLVVNFNLLAPLALLSLPALVLTSVVDNKRLGGPTNRDPNSTSPFLLLAIRLSPFYLWFSILSSQAHKEERFMFPAYTILVFNASVSIYLIRGWIETAYIKLTKSPYKASKSSLFKLTTLLLLTASTLFSVSRILALGHYYHAPLQVAYYFEASELPRVLNVTGLLAPPRPMKGLEGEKPRVDLSPLKELNLTLCVGKEWYRFPSHWLVPDGVHVDFVKNDFDGMLPRHFDRSTGSSRLWPREATRREPEGLNDLNKENLSHYVSIDTCHYLIDSDFPKYPISSLLEPRYAVDADRWDRAYCTPFLDSAHSMMITRVLWIPGEFWQRKNSFGEFCLLRRRGLFT
ncbi:asparagine-linked glycosylation 9 protein isoform a [Rickenella mellea]|uniref:Mannosyltransferase n=1 Tax=Rickenella mellea TaxID=50990 RepID=A0A4Y7QMA3_9AGAM|nr:asparagine-linked glycosylation 9 protein isoform a [Rickenella mellea]